MRVIKFNARKVESLFDEYFSRWPNLKYLLLPSTSPANKGMVFADICKEWTKIVTEIHHRESLVMGFWTTTWETMLRIRRLRVRSNKSFFDQITCDHKFNNYGTQKKGKNCRNHNQKRFWGSCANKRSQRVTINLH